MIAIVLYVIGAPGAGKTTLVRSLLGFDGLKPPDHYVLTGKPGPKWTLVEHPVAARMRTKDMPPIWGICAAGHYTGDSFDGGDTVAYNGAIPAMTYWEDNLLPKGLLTILDGDRFSNGSVLSFLRSPFMALRTKIIGVHLVAGPETLDARRRERGSNQSPSWMKGRETKAKNFANLIDAVSLAANAPVSRLHEQVSTLVNDTREKMRG